MAMNSEQNMQVQTTGQEYCLASMFQLNVKLTASFELSHFLFCKQIKSSARSMCGL